MNHPRGAEVPIAGDGDQPPRADRPTAGHANEPPRADRPTAGHAGSPTRADVAITVAVAAIQLGITTIAARHQPEATTLGPLGYALLATSALALLWRRHAPVAVLAATFALTAAYVLADYPGGPVFLALLVALMTVFLCGHRLIGWATLAAGYVTFGWLEAALGNHDAPSVGQAVGSAAWLLVLGLVGEGVRVQRERARERALARASETRRQVGEERLRISRELHDVLAHNVSLINVQSSVALHLIDEQPEQAREALAAIKQASGETLREMRAVLGSLRDSDETLPRAPAPTLARLDELVAQVRAAGVTVRLHVDGDPTGLPTAVDLAAYRIVQEALTNVTRHAPGAGADVRVRCHDGAIELQIDDDGPGPGGGRWDAERHGNGITGMGERAAALGGELHAGPGPGGRGFRVRARLPIGAPR